MSVSVGAFSSKSRLITAANWSSVSKTEKSSAGKKLKGKTIRPYRLTTNGFMWAPSTVSFRVTTFRPTAFYGKSTAVGATTVPDAGGWDFRKMWSGRAGSCCPRVQHGRAEPTPRAGGDKDAMSIPTQRDPAPLRQEFERLTRTLKLGVFSPESFGGDLCRQNETLVREVAGLSAKSTREI